MDFLRVQYQVLTPLHAAYGSGFFLQFTTSSTFDGVRMDCRLKRLESKDVWISEVDSDEVWSQRCPCGRTLCEIETNPLPASRPLIRKTKSIDQVMY